MSSKDVVGATKDLLKLPPEEFLHRTKATNVMQDAVNLVLEYRPEQPLTFLAKYFQMMCGDLSPVEISAFYIQSCGTVSNSSFEDTLVLAYHALKKHSDATGVELQAFQQLLHLLCEDIPCAPNAKLVQYLAPADASPSVSYAKFKHAIDVCLLYGEVISEGEDLFQSIDAANAGEIKTSVLISALEIAGASKTTTTIVQLVGHVRAVLERVTSNDANASISLGMFLATVAQVVLPIAFC